MRSESAPFLPGRQLERAAAITAVAGQLQISVQHVRTAAGELVDVAGMTPTDVAELLGSRPARLFPRVRPAYRTAPTVAQADVAEAIS